MKKVGINEHELADRWGLSPKTLRRWRSEGRGPRYLKLAKRVTYLIEDIPAYEMESMHSATWEKGNDVALSKDQNLMSAKEIAEIMNTIAIAGKSLHSPYMNQRTPETKTPPIAGRRLYSGGQSRNRTTDTRIFNPLLYQLS